MKFKLFDFGWLRSSERVELEKLRNEKKQAELVKTIEDTLEKRDEERFGAIKKLFDETPMTFEELKPFKSCRLIGTTCLVVLNDGTTLSKEGPELVGKVRQAQSEEEILQLFMIVQKQENKQENNAEEQALVGNNLHILEGNEDFIIEGQEVFLKGVHLAIPPIVLVSFIELLEKIDSVWEDVEEEGCISCDIDELEDQYQALKMFWYWTALNPIESSRRDLLRFVRENDINITANGLLICYRRVNKKNADNHELISFISNQYNKIKKWKKSPKNYWVWTSDSRKLELKEVEGPNGIEAFHGNLEELYLDLPNMQEDSYTDNRTRKMDIRIGSIYKEDEDKIDLDNTRDCSSGLHVGARTFGFDGFGDVGVIALVNPMFVRSVPLSSVNKMRVSEMYILAVADIEEYDEIVEKGEILDYSNEYCSETLEDLEQMIKDKRVDRVSCQENLPVVSVMDIVAIKDLLRDRIVNI